MENVEIFNFCPREGLKNFRRKSHPKASDQNPRWKSQTKVLNKNLKWKTQTKIWEENVIWRQNIVYFPKQGFLWNIVPTFQRFVPPYINKVSKRYFSFSFRTHRPDSGVPGSCYKNICKLNRTCFDFLNLKRSQKISVRF